MGKLWKILGVLLLLVIALVAGAALVIDPNDFKSDIQSEFRAATGHELVISGDLRLSLFPRPALEVEQVSVPASPGFNGPPLATLQRVRFYPRIWPLLRGRLELDLVRVEGLHLQLALDRQGRANWEAGAAPSALMQPFLAAAREARTRSTIVPGLFDVQAAETPSAADGLVIGGVEILSGRIVWEDRGTGRRLALDEVTAFAGPIRSGEPIPMRIRGALSNGGGNRHSELRAQGKLVIEGRAQQLRVEALTLQLDGLELQSGLAANLRLGTDLVADLRARRYLADAATLDTRLSGQALFGSSVDAIAKARVELDLSSERLEVSNLSIRSGALQAQGAATGERLLSTPIFMGDLAVDELDLRAWLRQQGLSMPPMADAETLRHVSLSGHWRLEGAQLSVQPLALKIDQTEIKGEVRRFASGSPVYSFDLVADRLDLDRYLPPWEQPQGTPATSLRLPLPKPLAGSVELAHARALVPDFFIKTAAASAGGSGPGVPPTASPAFLQSIANLSLNGRIRFDQLKLARLRFGEADLKARAKQGDLVIGNRVKRFYDGRLTGRLGLNVRGREPSFTLAQQAEGIQIGPLLTDFDGWESVTGRGEITADLTARGLSADALRRSLDGNLGLHITGGAIKGIDLKDLAAQAQPLLQDKKLMRKLPKQIDFNDLRATAKVQDGVASNRDLVVTTRYARITGAGTLDLVREHVDYRFKPMLVKPPKGKGRGIKELEGVPIPVDLKGPLDHPKWKVHLSAALKAGAERQLQKRGDKLFKKLEERTGIKGLEQGLKGLLGR